MHVEERCCESSSKSPGLNFTILVAAHLSPPTVSWFTHGYLPRTTTMV